MSNQLIFPLCVALLSAAYSLPNKTFDFDDVCSAQGGRMSQASAVATEAAGSSSMGEGADVKEHLAQVSGLCCKSGT